MRVALGQMTSNESVEGNFQQMQNLLNQIQRPETTDLVCFPENSLYMRIREGEKVQGLSIDHEIFKALSQEAQKRNLNLHLGSVALRDGEKLSNASVFIAKTGVVKKSYVKIHLFDIELEGHPPVRESDVYKHGEKPEILTLEGWNLGQSICYDMRFSELYAHYARAKCEVLMMPSSFLVPTGKVHWEILLRARAIESQAYVLAVAQAGEHQSALQASATRSTYGHSLVVDPWGQVIAQGSAAGPQLLEVELHQDLVHKVRRQMPMASHRRL